MSEAPEKILDIRNLDISFKTNAGIVHAIRGVNLDLCRGETVAIVGESGSGKSVTMKAAMGLLDSNAVVNSGEILYTFTDRDGTKKTVDLLQLSKKELRGTINGQRIAMVFQDPMTSLDPTMTIGKQIMEGMFLHRKMDKNAARKRAIELLELVGLGYDQFCKACILAQNSFSNFLKANDFEKADILEKITGTSIYGRIADIRTD